MEKMIELSYWKVVFKQHLPKLIFHPSPDILLGVYIIIGLLTLPERLFKLLVLPILISQILLNGRHILDRESADTKSFVSISLLKIFVYNNFHVGLFELLAYRSEFGGHLLFFYICDRTNLFGQSEKVMFNFLI